MFFLFCLWFIILNKHQSKRRFCPRREIGKEERRGRTVHHKHYECVIRISFMMQHSFMLHLKWIFYVWYRLSFFFTLFWEDDLLEGERNRMKWFNGPVGVTNYEEEEERENGLSVLVLDHQMFKMLYQFKCENKCCIIIWYEWRIENKNMIYLFSLF